MILSPPAIVFHFSPVVHNDYAGKDDDGDDEIITFYVEGKVRLVPKHQAPRGTPEQSKHYHYLHQTHPCFSELPVSTINIQNNISPTLRNAIINNCVIIVTKSAYFCI